MESQFAAGKGSGTDLAEQNRDSAALDTHFAEGIDLVASEHIVEAYAAVVAYLTDILVQCKPYVDSAELDLHTDLADSRYLVLDLEVLVDSLAAEEHSTSAVAVDTRCHWDSHALNFLVGNKHLVVVPIAFERNIR